MHLIVTRTEGAQHTRRFFCADERKSNRLHRFAVARRPGFDRIHALTHVTHDEDRRSAVDEKAEAFVVRAERRFGRIKILADAFHRTDRTADHREKTLVRVQVLIRVPIETDETEIGGGGDDGDEEDGFNNAH